MPVVNDIFNAMLAFAPMEGKMPEDNAGLLAGDSRAEVNRILTALDITGEVIAEAAGGGAQLIVAHHPVIYKPVSAVTDTSETGGKLLSLITKNIAAICMHTNLDAAPLGVNDALAKKCGLRNLTLPDVEAGFYPDGTRYAICRAGFLEKPTSMAEYLPFLKNSLGANGLRYYDAGRPVHHAVVIGGSGSDYLNTAAGYGCDTFITSDIKYNVFLSAKRLGINLIDAGHFATENIVIPVITDYLRESFPDISIEMSKVHCQTDKFFV